MHQIRGKAEQYQRRSYWYLPSHRWLTSFLYDSVSAHGVPLAIVSQEDEVILRVQLHILHEGVVLVHPHRSPSLHDGDARK